MSTTLATAIANVLDKDPVQAAILSYVYALEIAVIVEGREALTEVIAPNRSRARWLAAQLRVDSARAFTDATHAAEELARVLADALESTTP